MSARKIASIWLFVPIVFILFTGGSLLYLFTKNEDSFLNNEISKQRDKAILEQKYQVRQDVGDTMRYIEYQNSQIEDKLQKRLKMQTHLAYDIAQNIYRTYHKKESKRSVKKRILAALKPFTLTKKAPLRLTDYSGYCQLSELCEHKEKKLMYNNKDFMGRDYVQEEISIAKIRKDDFLENSFIRKGHKESSQRITHIKDLGFFDWYLSASFYVDDALKEFEEEIVHYLQKLQTDRDRYFFIIDTQGNVITHPFMEKGKNIIGLKDRKGLAFIKEMINLTAQYGGSFLEYWWSIEDDEHEKLLASSDVNRLSYVRIIDSLEWIVGSGFYVNEVVGDVKDRITLLQEHSERRRATMMDNALIIFVVLLLVSMIVSRILGRKLEKFNDKRIDNENRLEEENRLLQERVKQSVNSLKKSINLMQEYVYSSNTDLDGFITDVSDSFCEMTGYKKEELVGRTHAILKDESTPKDIYEEMWIYIKSGRIWKGELQNVRKDGSSYWSQVTIIHDINEHGEHIGYIALRQDITNEKLLNQKQSQIAEQSKYVAMGELIEIMVAQWSQPLATMAISANQVKIGLSLDNMGEEQIEEHMKEIHSEALSLSNTMEHFREFFRSASTDQLIGLNELVNETLKLLSGLLASEKIEVEVENRLSSKRMVNRNELVHVLMRIIKNIRHLFESKAIENPKIRIQILEVGHDVVIEITDNSGGFSDEELAKLFSEKGNSNNGITCSLYQSRTLIQEQLNGTLEAINHEDGTVMRIVLPE